MKQQLQQIFAQAIDQLKAQEVLPADLEATVLFERTRQKEHGDLATNIAMMLAKAAKSNPRNLAEQIVAALPQDSLIEKVEIAGPGFINVFLAQQARYLVLDTIFQQQDDFGLGEKDSKAKIMVEFVSANPTGPLHVGHGRGAAYGDTLARVLTAAGNTVVKEYYVNDAGRQMDILATSVWLRYLQQSKLEIALPENAYQGDYIIDMANQLLEQHANQYIIQPEKITQAIDGLDAEAGIDAIIQLAKSELGDAGYAVFFDCALNSILDDIKDDLDQFGVQFDNWFSERSLFDNGEVERVIDTLKKTDYLYQKEGAWWFKSSELGDEKDRVVVRENGAHTYFASDIAYHVNKFERGFDQCINIWGADHHGYIPRVKAALQALSLDADKLTVLLVQFAVLFRNGEKVQMSTRGGKFVTLRELHEEIGVDAARFFYVQRKSEQHMDFDLDLAKSQSNDNPVYYVQYAHARICRLFDQAAQRDITINDPAQSDYSLLQSEQENTLLDLLQRFSEVIQSAAQQYEPHQLTYYLRDLATAFHSYYNSTKFLQAPAAQRDAMLALSAATKQVLKNGLTIIGVGAPETM